ncbi:MAG: hypothetical protein CTY25_07300 [Methylobacterium sp.]|nr:MAG: hypothetical protein CTY25_07300 [Methylobacterium sp.]
MARGARGFSLIEALIALALFSMIVALLQGGVWSSRLLLRAVQPDRNVVVDTLILGRVLDSWLGSATLLTDRQNGQPLGMSGDARAVSFPYLARDRGDAPHLAIARLRIERGSGDLWRLSAESVPLGEQPGDTGPVTLVEWRGELSFRYAALRADGSAETVARWADSGLLPARVSLVGQAGPVHTVQLGQQPCQAPRDPEKAARREPQALACAAPPPGESAPK